MLATLLILGGIGLTVVVLVVREALRGMRNGGRGGPGGIVG